MKHNSSIVIFASYFVYATSFYTPKFVITKQSISAGFGKLPTKDEGINVIADVASKCLCGSDIVYQDCCEPYHDNKINDPESLIRSRYSAYASSNIDYIIATTSKLSLDYIAFVESPIAPLKALKRWSKSIKSNMIDEFRYVRMEIDSVSYFGDEEASVLWRHLAIRKADNVMYPIEEKSTIAKEKGIWSYVKGEVSRPSTEFSQAMMNDWPKIMGLELKIDEEKVSEGSESVPKSAASKRPMMNYEGSKQFKSKQTQSQQGPVKKNSERSGQP